MTHPRELIRDGLVAKLETVPALAGRVFATRTRPTDAEELPVALIYTLRETSELTTIGGDLRRTLSAAIELRIAATGAMDNELDELSESVEDAIGGDRRLGGLAFMTTLTSTTITLDGEGETPQGLATLTYTIIYDTAG